MVKKKIKFAKNFQKLREKNHLSQEVLAERLEVSRQTIYNWEAGTSTPNIEVFCAICELFDISLEKMIYGKVSDAVVSNDVYDSSNSNEYSTQISKSPYYIDSVREKGLHYITDEILREFWFIAYDIVDILIIALELKKRGFNIIELFGNGFSIFINSNKEALKFQSALYDIRDDFIHHDNEFIIEKKETLSKKIDIAINDAIDTVFSELYGKNIDEFSYYWTDEDENIRGYADTKEECVLQAKEQECLKYRIIDAE